jgi:hypothetical protein
VATFVREFYDEFRHLCFSEQVLLWEEPRKALPQFNILASAPTLNRSGLELFQF